MNWSLQLQIAVSKATTVSISKSRRFLRPTTTRAISRFEEQASPQHLEATVLMKERQLGAEPAKALDGPLFARLY
jgi:hypothetical protein